MAELAVRTVCSLAVVVGLLLLLARFAGRRYRGGTSTLRVVQRQSLSRGTAVTVVEVGNRTLVLGVTEQQVQVLAELAPGELDAAAGPEAEVAAEPAPARRAARPRSHLAAVRTPAAPVAPAAPAVPVVPAAPVAPAAVPATPGEFGAFAESLLRELEQAGPEADLLGVPGPPAPAASTTTGAGRHAARHRDTPARATVAPRGTGSEALAGSLLSPQTWRQTWQAVSRRAS